jgi:hypothetical protein
MASIRNCSWIASFAETKQHTDKNMQIVICLATLIRENINHLKKNAGSCAGSQHEQQQPIHISSLNNAYQTCLECRFKIKNKSMSWRLHGC